MATILSKIDLAHVIGEDDLFPILDDGGTGKSVTPSQVRDMVYPLTALEISEASLGAGDIDSSYPVGNVFRYKVTGDDVDTTAAFQLAIDTHSAIEGGVLHIPGPFTYRITDTIELKPNVWLQGVGYNGLTKQLSKIKFVNAGAAKTGCIVIDESAYAYSQNIRIRDLEIECDTGWDNIIKADVAKWLTIENCRISGNPTNSAIYLDDTLYTYIYNNFIQTTTTGGAKGIDAQDRSTTYYGTNFSFIDKNQFSCVDNNIFVSGTIAITRNSFEQGAMDNTGIILVDGHYTNYVVIEDNYWEVSNASGASNPLVAISIQHSCITLSIQNNQIHGSESADALASVAIDLGSAAHEHAIIEGNNINRWSYGIEASNNSSSNISTNNVYKNCITHVRYFTDESPSIPGTGFRSAIQHEERNRILTLGKCHVDVWQYPSSVTTVALQYGNNIKMDIAATPTLDFITDAGLYMGARVTLWAVQTFKIAHDSATALHKIYVESPGIGYSTGTVTITGGGGATADFDYKNTRIEKVDITDPGSGYTSSINAYITDGDGTGGDIGAVRQTPFDLAGGVEITVPAGRVIEFMVTDDNILREIGDYSARIAT